MTDQVAACTCGARVSVGISAEVRLDHRPDGCHDLMFRDPVLGMRALARIEGDLIPRVRNPRVLIDATVTPVAARAV